MPIATAVSFTAVNIESCDENTPTPPTTTVSVRDTLLVTNRGSPNDTVTRDCPLCLPRNVLTCPALSPVAGGTVAVVLRETFAIPLADFGVFLADVEGFGQLAGGEDAEGLLREGVEAVELAAGIDFAAEAVESGEEMLAVAEPIDRDAAERQVRLPFAIGPEGGVSRAEKTGMTG